jgi:hypothetical protein
VARCPSKPFPTRSPAARSHRSARTTSCSRSQITNIPQNTLYDKVNRRIEISGIITEAIAEASITSETSQRRSRGSLKGT